MQAFQRLHHEGLVECVPQWGVRVRTFNVHDLRHLYEMRISLESMVCRELAVRLDDVESAVRDLCSLAEEVDRADETLRLNVLKGIEHLGATLEIDQQFHSALAELSGLNLVKREIDRLLLFPVTFQDFFPREQSASIRHVDLLETILTGDPVEAERVVRDSIDSVATPTLSCLAEEFGEGPIIFPQETSQDMREAIG
jgi:DNA-binding GntR family transcriptional regulator